MASLPIRLASLLRLVSGFVSGFRKYSKPAWLAMGLKTSRTKVADRHPGPLACQGAPLSKIGAPDIINKGRAWNKASHQTRSQLFEMQSCPPACCSVIMYKLDSMSKAQISHGHIARGDSIVARLGNTHQHITHPDWNAGTACLPRWFAFQST
jgi:hypothetical protein